MIQAPARVRLESVLQDLRYTLRTLRRDAGFTTFAVLIVGNLAIECLVGWWLGWLAQRRSCRPRRRYYWLRRRL